jgi:hypothetical protein
MIKAQNLDLIYSQSSTMHDIIPHALKPLTDPKNPNPRPHANDVVGFVSHASVNQLVEQMGHMSISSHPSAASYSA